MEKAGLVEPWRMFEHACAFVDCAKYTEIEPNNIEYRMNSHTVSGIVNSAFACEVFIKSLLVYHGIPVEKIKHHELKKLWNKFREKDISTALSIERRMQNIFLSENENMFSELLDNISNAFDYWRYIYEKSRGGINYNFLRIFRDLLREKCCKELFKKSWQEYKKAPRKT